MRDFNKVLFKIMINTLKEAFPNYEYEVHPYSHYPFIIILREGRDLAELRPNEKKIVFLEGDIFDSLHYAKLQVKNNKEELEELKDKESRYKEYLLEKEIEVNTKLIEKKAAKIIDSIGV